MRRERSLKRRMLAAGAWGGALAAATALAIAGCNGWDPRRPFERNAPAVDDAIEELDAGRQEPAEKLLAEYLGATGRCSADAGFGLPEAARQKADGTFDLGLSLFYLGERFGRRFGDEEGGDGGAEDRELMQRRSMEIDCALAVVQAIAQDPKVPAELRARARYLAGNLEFMRRRYEQAVKEYDQALAIVPGLLEEAGGDGIGRDAAWNRAIALRRIQDQQDAGTDAPDSSDGDDGSDGSDAADGSDGSDAADASDGSDAGPDGGDGGDGGDKGDGGDGDGGNKDGDGGQQDGGRGDGGAQPKEPPPQPASPQQDERMLELLEQAPSYQQKEAKQRAMQRRGRPTMEDK